MLLAHISSGTKRRWCNLGLSAWQTRFVSALWNLVGGGSHHTCSGVHAVFKMVRTQRLPGLLPKDVAMVEWQPRSCIHIQAGFSQCSALTDGDCANTAAASTVCTCLHFEKLPPCKHGRFVLGPCDSKRRTQSVLVYWSGRP